MKRAIRNLTVGTAVFLFAVPKTPPGFRAAIAVPLPSSASPSGGNGRTIATTASHRNPLISGANTRRGRVPPRRAALSTVRRDSSNPCPMCDDLLGLKTTHQKLYGSKDGTLLFQTKNFHVAMDSFPVMKNHLLIIPRHHYLSFSTITSRKMAIELEAVINTVSSVVGTKKYALFEHGSNEVGGIQKPCGNSVYHAHMHFMPDVEMTRKEIVKHVQSGQGTQKLRLKGSSKFEDCIYRAPKKSEKLTLDFLRRDLPTNEPYLFCSFSSTRGDALCVPDNKIDGNKAPSQFFRRVFAEIANPGERKPFFNWKLPDEVARSSQARTSRVQEAKALFGDKAHVSDIFNQNLKALNDAWKED